MDTKKQIQAYIERTNSLIHSTPKSLSISNELFSTSAENSPIKKVSKVSSKTLKVISLQSPKTTPSKTPQRKRQAKKPQNVMEKATIEFIKSTNFALNEFMQLSEMKRKKNREFQISEEKNLKYLNNAISEYRKKCPKEENGLNEKYDRSIKEITKATAAELSVLGQKCHELEEENAFLRKALWRNDTSKGLEELLTIKTEGLKDENKDLLLPLTQKKIKSRYLSKITEITQRWCDTLPNESMPNTIQSISLAVIKELQLSLATKEKIATTLFDKRNRKHSLEERLQI